jgi:hypothetical protein
VSLPQRFETTNAAPGCNDLNIRDVADDVKHDALSVVSQRYDYGSAQRLADR